MANFGVRLVHGPGWDPLRQIRDQDGWDEHAAFMDGLVEDGFIILGGPVGDGEQTLHAVEAADEKEIRARLARNPRQAGPSEAMSLGPVGSASAGVVTSGGQGRILGSGFLAQRWPGVCRPLIEAGRIRIQNGRSTAVTHGCRPRRLRRCISASS